MKSLRHPTALAALASLAVAFAAGPACDAPSGHARLLLTGVEKAPVTVDVEAKLTVTQQGAVVSEESQSASLGGSTGATQEINLPFSDVFMGDPATFVLEIFAGGALVVSASRTETLSTAGQEIVFGDDEINYADSDGDGISDLYEYLVGSDAASSSDIPQLAVSIISAFSIYAAADTAVIRVEVLDPLDGTNIVESSTVTCTAEGEATNPLSGDSFELDFTGAGLVTIACQAEHSHGHGEAELDLTVNDSSAGDCTVPAQCGSGACCSNVCVDTTTDPSHCTACHNACTAQETCSGNGCVATATICDPYSDADGDGFFGCSDTVCDNFADCGDGADVVCTSGTDNDGDGVADCDEESCDGDVGCGGSASGIKYVRVDGSPTGNASSWGNAHSSLAEVLSNAADGDEIWVGAGVYKPGSALDDTFAVPNGVALFGGFAGDETIKADREPTANATILSGDVNGDDLDNFTNRSDNVYHVVTFRDTVGVAVTVLDGFTISGGNAADAPGLGGGALYIENNSPEIIGCTMTGNSSAGVGGAVSIRGGNPIFIHSQFGQNTATTFGGAVFTNQGRPKFENCSFKENRATDGAAVSIQGDAAPVFMYTEFTANSGGGAVIVDSTSTTDIDFVGCQFFGNTGTGGAAMRVMSGQITIVNSLFVANSDSPAIVTDIPAGVGAQLDIFTSTFAHNNYGCVTAERGGNVSIQLTLTHTPGGATEFDKAGVSAFEVRDSCLSMSTVHSVGSNMTHGYNPNFVDPDGIDTAPGTGDEDFHLMASSPCANIANQNALPQDRWDLDSDGDTTEFLPVDLDSTTRNASLVDAGAYTR